jgi:subtilisin family serine protease
MAAAIKNLVDAGVTVFAATGNRGSSTSMPAPACNTGVIAVGAVYDSSAGRQPPTNVGTTYAARWGAAFAACSDANSAFDQIACFTNSTARMDLLAPGAPMLSDSLRGRTEMYWGTSQAAPVAVGVAALMLECNPKLTPAELKKALVSTGVPRMDSRNSLSFPSLRALAAVQAVCDEDDLPDGSVPASDGGSLEAGTAADAAVIGSGGGDAAVTRDAGGAPAEAGALPTTPPDASVNAVVVPGATHDASTPGGLTPPKPSSDCDCAVAGLPRRRAPWTLTLVPLLLLGLALRRRRPTS